MSIENDNNYCFYFCEDDRGRADKCIRHRGFVPWRHGGGLAFVSDPGAFGDVAGDPSEKTVMFLNVPFSRETAVLSGMSDEPKRRSPLRRGVLPRWQPPG